jgi:hypothetical protein
MKNLFNIIGLTILVSLSIVSCNKPYYNFETKELDYVNKIDGKIKGEKMDIEALGLKNYIVCDSLLLAITSNPNGQLSVFSLNSGKKIANLCVEGRARNEFIYPNDITDQVYKNEKGHIIAPIIDNFINIKEVDVTESIERQQTVVISQNSCRNMYFGSFVLLDNNPKHRFEVVDPYQHETKENKLVPIEYKVISPDSSTTSINVFPKQMEYETSIVDVINAYWSVLFKHPSRNFVIQPLMNMDYILFFDFDNGHNFAIHQIGTTSFSDKAPDLSKYDYYPMRFGDVAFYDDGFFILYYASDNPQNSKELQYPDVLRFDFEGNFIQGLRMETPIGRIEFDKSRNRLIGVDMADETLYSFDLSEYIAQ